MKLQNFIIILLLSYSFNYLKSQPYQSIFGKDSTQWNVFGGNIDALHTKIFKCYNDTYTYEGLDYKIIYDYTNYMNTAAYLREDTLTGKIWNGNELIMDISLNKNDTFHLGGEYAIVDTVYLKDNKKHIYFNQNLSSINEKLHFIEGVGPNNIFNLLFYSTLGAKLLCYYKDSALSYKNNNECFRTEYSSENLNLNQISLFPNPASDIIIVVINDSLLLNNIFLIDNNGITHKTITICNKFNQIDISELTPGCYYVYYYSEDDNIFIKPFIKK